MPIDPPYPSKQLAIHQLLVAARRTVLHEALAAALGRADPDVVGRQIQELSPPAARQRLAQAGIRNEHVFATPEVLSKRPTVLGYYRLLLGVPQKQFYTSETGLSRFKTMETRDRITGVIAPLLPALCLALNAVMAELVLQLDPEISPLDLQQLPLLTLGAQFDGMIRNDIGRAATGELFLVIREIVEAHLTAETDTTLTLENASGRQVRVALASDPDVCIFEHFGDEQRLNVAIENKGGTDRSNAHNRAGEAEKSHQKVRGRTGNFWTVIALKGVNRRQLETESPTTTEWFNVSEVLARSGADYERFRRRLVGAVGISLDGG